MRTINYTSYVVQSEDGFYIVSPNDSKGINAWFAELAHTLAFSDCSDEEVVLIIYEGKELHYVGWQPNMLYEFADEEGNIVWSNSFPQWDH